MNTRPACVQCGCTSGAPSHPVLAALRDADVDAAIDRGLLDIAPCPQCSGDCNARLLHARDERRFALAARERHRARAGRLKRRAEERDARRMPPAAEPVGAMPALPPAAAAALARAKAKAATRKPR